MTPERKTCPQCSHSNPATWVACANCGASLTTSARPPSPATHSSRSPAPSPNFSSTSPESGGCWRGFEQGCGFGCGCLFFILVLFFGLVYLGTTGGSSSGVTSSGSSGLVTQNRFTLRQYNTLQTGMSYRQASAIMGAYGTEMARNSIGSYETVVYGWSNSDGSNINLTFQNDQLVQKAQAGLY